MKLGKLAQQLFGKYPSFSFHANKLRPPFLNILPKNFNTPVKFGSVTSKNLTFFKDTSKVESLKFPFRRKLGILMAILLSGSAVSILTLGVNPIQTLISLCLLYAGLASFQRGDYKGAIAYYDYIIKYDSKGSIIALNNKGLALLYLKDYHEADACFDKAISLSPKYNKPWINKGLLRVVLGDFQAAISCFDQSLKIESDIMAFHYKALALFQLAKYRDSIKCLDKAIEIDSNAAIGLLVYKVVALYQLKDMHAAISCANKTIDFYSKRLISTDRSQPSEKAFLLATLEITFSAKAHALVKLGRNKEAIACYDEALTLNPSSLLIQEERKLLVEKKSLPQIDKPLNVFFRKWSLDGQGEDINNNEEVTISRNHD